MKYTHHAEIRAQQRGIPPLIVEWLQDYGRKEYAGKGTRKIFFDKNSRKILAKKMGKSVVDSLGHLMNIYLVEEDNQIITVGHRHKHIRRNI